VTRDTGEGGVGLGASRFSKEGKGKAGMGEILRGAISSVLESRRILRGLDHVFFWGPGGEKQRLEKREKDCATQ